MHKWHLKKRYFFSLLSMAKILKISPLITSFGRLFLHLFSVSDFYLNCSAVIDLKKMPIFVIYSE